MISQRQPNFSKFRTEMTENGHNTSQGSQKHLFMSGFDLESAQIGCYISIVRFNIFMTFQIQIFLKDIIPIFKGTSYISRLLLHS